MEAPQETCLIAGLSRDGARHRDADRAARLPCGVVDRGGEARALSGDRGDGPRDDRRVSSRAAGLGAIADLGFVGLDDRGPDDEAVYSTPRRARPAHSAEP
ncbi:hypothetical protein [Streptomyces canus]|uniref:hypothetical protein n=1 Tax=Streptomyces canus TaxID=58343 RepID=UPI0027843615|nr:hypothetical protein [Streptomyces canus]MDQ0766320.1 hypothetical protein [Streptomyces canus]MDQ1065577.1 hypothetical protein [Streptomyces canus]